MPCREFSFPTYDATIELTDSNTVEWLFKRRGDYDYYYNEFKNTDIPDSFGGIANFYHIVVALHESYLYGKSSVGTLVYSCYNANGNVSICYSNGIKLECDTKLSRYSTNSMKTTTPPTENEPLPLPPIVEDKPYYIRYCKEICNLLPNTVKGVKIDNTLSGGDLIFTCKNFEELQTHIDVFRQIHPKFTHENLISVLKYDFCVDGKCIDGICIFPTTRNHTDYYFSWTKQKMLCDEINAGLKKLAYERMLAEFK